MSEKIRPSDPPILVEEVSLNEALSDLEHMLDGPGDEDDTAGDEDSTSVQGEQYTIPLLDDVVVPGVEVLDDINEPVAPIRRQLESVEDDESQAVIRRLTNEIEVIVQIGMEEAVRGAVKNITKEVKKHIAIMLPEILDEIADIKARKNRI